MRILLYGVYVLCCWCCRIARESSDYIFLVWAADKFEIEKTLGELRPVQAHCNIMLSENTGSQTENKCYLCNIDVSQSISLMLRGCSIYWWLISIQFRRCSGLQHAKWNGLWCQHFSAADLYLT